MKRLLAILALVPALVSAQAAPVLTATWHGAHAEIRWSVPGNLYRHGADGVEVWLGRFETAGSLSLPDGPDDARHPMVGDKYVLKGLVEDRVLGVAELGRVEVRLVIVVKPPG